MSASTGATVRARFLDPAGQLRPAGRDRHDQPHGPRALSLRRNGRGGMGRAGSALRLHAARGRQGRRRRRGLNLPFVSSMNRQVSIIGAPTDIGAGSRGASMGPEALRVANIVPVLQGHGLEVVDRGNLTGPANPWLPPADGYRHLAEVVAWNKAVHGAVHGELALGRLPVLLGGDHSLGLGSISAVARHCRETGRKLRILWLDAHADFNTHILTPSGNLHGMPVACLCGHGPQELIEIGGLLPPRRPPRGPPDSSPPRGAPRQPLLPRLGPPGFRLP